MPFWIVSDACCDLPSYYIRRQERLKLLPMAYQIDGTERLYDLSREDCAQTAHTIYELLLGGASSTTAQINQQTWMDELEPILKQGDDLLALVFSSALSGTYQAAALAAEELRAKYPERRIRVLDSLSASMGEGLLVHYALQYRDAGHGVDETADWVRQNVQRFAHWFTVNDLHFLRRGGRVSATSAYLGSILKIKPVLNVDPIGRLIPREKVQGRKHSLRALFDMVKEYAFEPEKQVIFIGHGDCEKDALWLKEKLMDELRVPEVLIGMIGPIIGSHSGPGTVAVFFLDKDGAARMDAPEK